MNNTLAARDAHSYLAAHARDVQWLPPSALMAEVGELRRQLARCLPPSRRHRTEASASRPGRPGSWPLPWMRPPRPVPARLGACTVCASWPGLCEFCEQLSRDAIGLRDLAGQLWKQAQP
jgi:hypothetical protein